MRRVTANRIRIGAAAWICIVLGAAHAASGQGPAQVTIATVNNMNHVPQFVAVEKGLYVAHGVDVKLRVLNSGAEATRALQAGEAQMATIGNTTLSAAWNAGIRLVAVVVVMGDATRVYYDDVFAITSRSGSGIRRLHVEDLVGRRVGMVLGGTGEEYFRALLAAAKIPAERITFVNVPSPNHVSVLREGGVDAEVTWEPYGTMILQQVPGAYVVLRGGGYLGYDLYMMGTEEFVRRHPSVVDGLVRGFVEAASYVRRHPVESAQIATRWIEGLDEASARKAITYMEFDPRFSANTLRAHALVERAMIDRGRIKQPVDLSKAIDASFLDRAMKESPQMFVDLKPVP
ncbi:MAG: ABC transporter substrate-binding protein [Bacillati bacterium ANGP1]|uniref:ABC transporter substrate-binding protein n=1 Tax=Candidatus Segetimicrobium genomatis TaxID=2569760 RepID=A0A537JZA2_9BACT|nr:MAG: ABC transporter substrate-binding protein [Terrabacteria group bacterium ANGP1]